MKIVINTRNIKTLKATGKQYDVRDKNLPGFMIRVSAKGKMSFVCQYERGKRINIGPVEHLSIIQARTKAKEILGKAAAGELPQQNPINTPELTLKEFIEKEYHPWAEVNLKRGLNAIKDIKRNFFETLGKKKLSQINIQEIERWRTHYLKNNGWKPGTANRYLGRLKSALSKAVEWNKIVDHPLRKVKPLKEDSGKVRYLTNNEEAALRTALQEREQEIKNSRDQGNEWRAIRNYELLPSLKDKIFVDHLQPMVLISINCGLRRSELFNLRWEDINFTSRTLTIIGSTSKTGKTRHIPLNTEAFNTLLSWQQEQCPPQGLVFKNQFGERFDNVNKAWKNILLRANIDSFRWHDMRHHFASKLVMAGVDLNTVRELLGHADISMTLRYAHLAPEHKAAAVEKISGP